MPANPRRLRPFIATALALGCLLPAPGAYAETGKLLLTGGVSSIDGAAGGGLTPWAVTGSYATDGQFGGTAHATRVKTQDYALTAYGAAMSFQDRVELSLAHQDFDTGATGTALGRASGSSRPSSARKPGWPAMPCSTATP